MHSRLSLLLLAVLLAGPAALAQSAGEVLREALGRYASEMTDVRDYTITQEVMGMTVTTYAERADGAAPLDYTYYVVTPSGLQGTDDADNPAAHNPYLMLDRIAEEARYVGTEAVGGTQAHVVAVDDFGDLAREFGTVPAQADGEFDIETATFYIGTNDYRIHRMTMDGTVTRDGQASPVQIDTRLADYRTVDGFTTPFRMAMTMQGMDGQMSESERAEARQQLDQLRTQMEQMPAEQRRMMEGMMGSQLERLEQMLGGGGFEMEMVVTDVQVNTGRPD